MTMSYRYFSIENPEVALMSEALDRERDGSPFVPDPPGALDALIKDGSSLL